MEKGALKSQTIVAAIVSIIAMVARKYGFDVGDTGAWVAEIVSLIGALWAIKGRYGAVKRIKGVV